MTDFQLESPNWNSEQQKTGWALRLLDLSKHDWAWKTHFCKPNMKQRFKYVRKTLVTRWFSTWNALKTIISVNQLHPTLHHSVVNNKVAAGQSVLQTASRTVLLCNPSRTMMDCLKHGDHFCFWVHFSLWAGV